MSYEQSDAFKPQTVHCPCCRGERVTSFYRLQNIPSHSVLLMNTRDEAIHFPTGDLELGVCHHCGFIFNLRFDEGLNRYAAHYEETQHFSPTFSQFAGSLCDRLIQDYGISGKVVLEIGCGKGEFLAELCVRGNNQGIGIDPACAPERLSAEAQSLIRFLPEFYGSPHQNIRADLICCRHTLEHIAPVRSFLQQIRDSVPEGAEPLIFFELPATEPILGEIRFWDIYYEHSSYFCEPVLRWLFEVCGFEILESEFAYDDQYLLLFAKPTAVPVSTAPPQDVSGIVKMVRQFESQVQTRLKSWRQKLAPACSGEQKIALWGAGSKCVAFVTTLGLSDCDLTIVDINPYKHGKYLPGTGHEVHSPDVLRTVGPDQVVIMNPIYRDEISAWLDEHRLTPEIVPV